MQRVLVIACGALAHELVQIKRLNQWDQVDIRCLPAELHNRPEKIPAAVEALIIEHQRDDTKIVLGYADCGTGGRLEALARRYNASLIPGAHCYEFFCGSSAFTELSEREIGTLYLTDYLARNFQRLLVKGMGIDRHPELKAMLFDNYRKVVYLAQDASLPYEAEARQAAAFLDLDYEQVVTGLMPLNQTLTPLVATTHG